MLQMILIEVSEEVLRTVKCRLDSELSTGGLDWVGPSECFLFNLGSTLCGLLEP